jgi:hypothetical protein
MPAVSIDHVFICTQRGAPAAEILKQAGLNEGAPNRHPGQGTACRRFFFANGMLELLWLEDEAEARSEQTRATRLWERLSAASPSSPFGVILKPSPGSEPVCPWPSWTYRPATMPITLEIAADTDLEEPMWCFIQSARVPSPPQHPVGFHQITGVTIGVPGVKQGSVTSAMANSGVIAVRTGVEPLLELEFDSGRQGTTLDFRPHLPLVLRG